MRMTKEGKITFSLLGAGGRGNAYINALNTLYKDKYQLVSIAESSKQRREKLVFEHNIADNLVFEDYRDFLKKDRISDVVILSTLDDMHYEPVMELIRLGYDIILEKPIAMTLEEVLDIGCAVEKHPNNIISVCHVLRCSPFFMAIKDVINNAGLGKIVNIQHNENIGYYHFAHSYVRGSWRNTDIAAPLSVAKSCHDFDILLYLLGDKEAVKLSSFGSLSHFNEKNFKPNIMAENCFNCSIENECCYSSTKIYNSEKSNVIVFGEAEKELKKNYKNSNYSKCVYKMDNNVCDHQVTIIEFDDNITATFNISAFTNDISRSIKIMCEYGEIRGLEVPCNIEYQKFGSNVVHTVKPLIEYPSGHNGSDVKYIQDFMEAYINGTPLKTDIRQSIESHVMAFMAEDSRINDGEVKHIKDIW